MKADEGREITIRIFDKGDQPPAGLINTNGADPYALMFSAMILMETVYYGRLPLTGDPEQAKVYETTGLILQALRGMLGVDTPTATVVPKKEGMN